MMTMMCDHDDQVDDDENETESSTMKRRVNAQRPKRNKMKKKIIKIYVTVMRIHRKLSQTNDGHWSPSQHHTTKPINEHQ